MTTMLATPEYLYDSSWFPDLGASSHVTTDPSNVLQGTEYNGPEQLHMNNCTSLSINKIGHSIVN